MHNLKKNIYIIYIIYELNNFTENYVKEEIEEKQKEKE